MHSYRYYLSMSFFTCVRFFAQAQKKKLCARKSFYSSAGFCRIKNPKNNRRGFCALRAGGRTERVFDKRISIQHGDVTVWRQKFARAAVERIRASDISDFVPQPVHAG